MLALGSVQQWPDGTVCHQVALCTMNLVARVEPPEDQHHQQLVVGTNDLIPSFQFNIVTCILFSGSSENPGILNFMSFI